MIKKIEIYQSVNLLNEAFTLLYYWANIDDLERTRDEYVGNYENEKENYMKKFNLIIGIYDYVKSNIKVSFEQVEYYFKERNTDISTFCSLAVLWDRHQYDKKILSYEEKFMELTERDRVKSYAQIIDHELAENTAYNELQSLTDLIRFIESSPYEKEAKWEAIKIFNNTEKYYKEAYAILEEVMELLEEHHDTINEIGQEFYEYWSEYQKTNDLVDTIQDKTKIFWEHSEKGITIVPLIFFPFSITISYDEVFNKTKDFIQISVLLDKRLELTNRKITKGDIINFGKILCDKSKVDILEYLGKKPAYGKEIADELNLTTATISYHVKSLQVTGFLKSTIDANKVYYSINNEGILAYIDDVKRYFAELGISVDK